MRKLVIPAMLLLLCLFAACGGQRGNGAIATRPDETTAEQITLREADPTTEPAPEPTRQSADDLLDIALVDRLFSMTYADFCREEGRKVEPEGMYDGGIYCYFSKYGDNTPFFFDYAEPIADNDLLNAVYMKAPDLLVGRQDLTLGELKNWLDEKGIALTIGDSEGFRFFFELGKFEFRGDLTSDNESAPILGFEVYCKSNYDNHLT